MAEVEIGGEFYWSYADIDEANAWMNGVIGPYGDAWRNATQEERSRGLVTGTRFIDAQDWRGEKTAPDQPGAFPRTGLGDVDPATIPPAVVQAAIELAAWFLEGSAFQNEANRASGTKRLKAGSAEIEYFRGGDSEGGGAALPPFFLNLLGQWLSGSGSLAGGSQSFGVCGKSRFKRGYAPGQAY